MTKIYIYQITLPIIVNCEKIISQLSRQAGRGWRSVVSANRLISQFPIPSFTVEIIYIITTIFITFLFTSIWNDKSGCSDISFQMQHCIRTYITNPKCWKIYHIDAIAFFFGFVRFWSRRLCVEILKVGWELPCLSSLAQINYINCYMRAAVCIWLVFLRAIYCLLSDSI